MLERSHTHRGAYPSFSLQDGDGKLSKTEFLSFSHPEEDQGMYDAVVKSLLRNKDKNGDGVIDFQVGSIAKTRDQPKGSKLLF